MDIKDDEYARSQLQALLLTMPEPQLACLLAVLTAEQMGEITFDQIEAASKAGDLFTETDPARFIERIRAAA